MDSLEKESTNPGTIPAYDEMKCIQMWGKERGNQKVF
jgi:hypothetical protein